jgi:hypothetical protein
MNYDPNEVAPLANGANLVSSAGSLQAAKMRETINNAKKRGFNLKIDVFSKCLDIMKAFKESENFQKLA